MKSEICNPPSAAAETPQTATSPEECHPAPTNSVVTPLLSRRLQGKIPALAKDHRDAINKLLLEGATYAVVVARMAEKAISLNAENVSNWYQTGFQDFLAQQERLDFQRVRYEAATDLLQDTDTSRLPEADIQTAAAQVYDLLGRFTPAAIAEKMADDPDKYTRLLNALSRLARESLALKKHRDACAQARAALLPLKDPKRKLTDSERHAIVHQVDDILGLGGPEEAEILEKYMKDGKFRYCPSEFEERNKSSAQSLTPEAEGQEGANGGGDHSLQSTGAKPE